MRPPIACPVARDVAFCAFALLFLAPLCGRTEAAEWEYLSMQGIHATCIVADPAHERIFVGTIEGFHYLDIPTGVWTERDWEGWIGRQVFAIATHDLHPQRVITGRENAFFKGYIELSDDLGQTETTVYYSAAGRVKDIQPRSEGANEYYACTWPDITPGEFVRSQDGGLTWTCLAPTHHYAMTAIAVDRTTEAIYLAGDQRVTRSYNGGDSWEPAWTGLPEGQIVHCLVADPGGECVFEEHLFAGNDLGLYEGYWEEQWERVLAIGCRRVTMVAWYTQMGPYWWPAVITSDGRVLVQEGDWVDETGSLAGLNPVDLAYCLSDHMLYVATANGGVYRAPFGFAGVETDAMAMAAPRAWPNPFHGGTRLRFTLDRPGPASLEILDAEGRCVTTLAHGWHAAGRHEVPWRPAAMPGGLYFARLRTGASTGSLRLLRLN